MVNRQVDNGEPIGGRRGEHYRLGVDGRPAIGCGCDCPWDGRLDNRHDQRDDTLKITANHWQIINTGQTDRAGGDGHARRRHDQCMWARGTRTLQSTARREQYTKPALTTRQIMVRVANVAGALHNGAGDGPRRRRNYLASISRG